MNDMAGFGRRLNNVRTLAGLSQTELAEQALTNQGTISDLERGKARDILRSSIVKLAAALSIDPGWLAFGTQQKPPS